ncbi:lymphocyte antigen 75-like [Acipenser ruthenus]|uniref:lymphocyte antigen 75-like n=1 Tax=Acipenser ruthenus TaxID=7906 RepID=UPI002740FEDD|nr:lymphocyte antigen 75-like [Acipenser ruthenus]XP_058865245.1 lymphocyte antigen 75-like [Acipenser ruthenus]
MEKNGLLILLLAVLCAVASGHFRKYHFVEVEKSWFDAQSYCREKHTDLATIESQEEADSLSKTRDKGKNEAWIGLYRDVKKNWQWSNSDAVIISNLEAEHDIIKKSDITKKSCVEADNHGKWTNEHCSTKNSFMCYKECSNSSKIYFLIEEGKTWYEAQQYCRKYYTDLVSIKFDTEKEKIKNIRKDGDKAFWIGLFNNLWKWSDGGDLDFQNWNSGKLSGDENKKCVSIHNEETWKDEKCDTELPFFCYDDGRQLFLVTENKTWEEAVEYCRSNHTDLVSIESKAEQIRVMKKAGNATSSQVWLGLRKSCTFGFWYWVDGAKHGYDQWAPGCPCQSEPNHCGAMDRMNGYNWTAQSCSERFNFICYKEMRVTP